MRQIAVAILERVGEHVARPASRAGVARVAVAAVRVQRQLAEGALDRRSQRRRIVQVGIGVARSTAHNHRPVGALHVRNAVGRVAVERIVPPVITLPVAGPGVPAATLSMSATAVGTSSMIVITRLPAGALSPSASVTTTAKLELLDGSTSVLSISV